MHAIEVVKRCQARPEAARRDSRRGRVGFRRRAGATRHTSLYNSFRSLSSALPGPGQEFFKTKPVADRAGRVHIYRGRKNSASLGGPQKNPGRASGGPQKHHERRVAPTPVGMIVMAGESAGGRRVTSCLSWSDPTLVVGVPSEHATEVRVDNWRTSRTQQDQRSPIVVRFRIVYPCQNNRPNLFRHMLYLGELSCRCHPRKVPGLDPVRRS